MIVNETIALTTSVVQADGNIVSDMGGEKVMLSIANGKYYNLGTVGGTIWEYIKEPISVEQLVDKLVMEFDVKRAVCEEQVVSFLQTLNKEGLIQVQTESVGRQ